MSKFKGMKLFKTLKDETHPLELLRKVCVVEKEDTIIGYLAICESKTGDEYYSFKISKCVYKQLEKYLDRVTIQ